MDSQFQSMAKEFEQAAKFPLGEICVTASVLSKIAPDGITIALNRHSKGDWGELDRRGQVDNEARLLTGGPLVSIFRSERDIEFYILTEADRSMTTVLLPNEY